MTSFVALFNQIRAWASDFGFQDIAVTDTDLSAFSGPYLEWLANKFHGSMGYMERNVQKRINPNVLIPDTLRVISARMDYLPNADSSTLSDPSKAYIARYALGRDYHKVMRRRLAKLAKKIEREAGGSYRAFVDSAPVLEKPLGSKAGLGWIGKNTLLLNRNAGSYFFLGEIYTDIPFPLNDLKVKDQCGSCKACITVCPTGAIVAPRKLDARRCISYLTIENKGKIPTKFRKLIGNRIFGCDDCQIFCPWNRFAQTTTETDFAIRHQLDAPKIIDLLKWDEKTFLARTRGMAIRRINYTQWVRNLAVAAGNSTSSHELVQILYIKMNEMNTRSDSMVIDHLLWAISQLKTKTNAEKSDLDRTLIPQSIHEYHQEHDVSSAFEEPFQ